MMHLISEIVMICNNHLCSCYCPLCNYCQYENTDINNALSFIRVKWFPTGVRNSCLIHIHLSPKVLSLNTHLIECQRNMNNEVE